MADESYQTREGRVVLHRSSVSRAVKSDPLWEARMPAELQGLDGEPLGIHGLVLYSSADIDRPMNQPLPNEVPVYRAHGAELIPTPEVLVQFKPEVPEKAREALFARLRADIVRHDEWSGEYTVAAHEGPPERSIGLANELYESGLVDYAQPNFVRITPTLRTTG